MATLTKSHPVSPDNNLISLSSSIPAPFSPTDRACILRSSQTSSLHHAITPPPSTHEDLPRAQEAPPPGEVHMSVDSVSPTDQDVMPSISRVQASVLTTLSDLLSPFSSHPPPNMAISFHAPSVSAQPASSSSRTVPPTVSTTSTAALRDLVTNLRHTEALYPEMIQVAPSDDDTALLRELSGHVDVLTPSLHVQDAQLVHALVSLLADLNRLSVLGVSPSSSTLTAAWNHDTPITDTGNLDTLARQLSEFQSQHHDQSELEGSLPPVVAVEKALLWVRIDENLETVLDLCRHRDDGPRFSPTEPPEYDLLSHDAELPPNYYPDRESFESDTKTLMNVSGPMSTDEKMRLDLDDVTTAIDRLYRVAPQLHNQRVELNKSKLEELKSAREAGEAPGQAGKQKERELERIVDMIGRASERKLVQQTVILGDMDARIERVRQRDVQKRQEFVDKLAEHSGSRRMHAQDAVFSSTRPKDPDALLTLPEFIREAVPPALQSPPDPNALLTLDEAAREHPTPPLTPGPEPLQRTKSLKGLRNRSMSAPSLSWLLPASSKSAEHATRSANGSSSRRSSSAGKAPLELQVSYVAEHHEGLRHVLAFLNVSGMMPGVNLEASTVNGSSDTSDRAESNLVLRSGSVVSSALALPAHTQACAQDVRVQGLHYEVKIATLDPQSPRAEPLPLLDAAQLRERSPTTFICASCSLPLVHGARVTRYDDLPSEHWAELVDAWMCHSDQVLNAQVARHAKGFWPQSGQALVGGSYVLFDKSAAVSANLRPAEKPKGEDWRLVRCMCGALCGRCQDHTPEPGEATVVYRLVKYAIRPVSPSAEPSRIPLSAFIVEDMAELARSHATYRFVVLDEEEERPRILMWLFKPNMRLSYKATKHYLLPEHGTIQAAKVLYKVINPSTSSADLRSLLDRYPGFPQAEQLMYPKDTCTQIALLLKESNACYPEGMRSMTRLDVGWLSRA